MIRKKVRGFNRRAFRIRDYINSIEYISNLFKESRSISSEAVKYYKECKKLGIEYIPNKVLPKELLNRIKELDEKFDSFDRLEIISIIKNDFKSKKIFIRLKNGFKMYDRRSSNEIKYNIIEGKLCIQLKD